MPAPGRIAFLSPRFADGPALGGAETLLRALARRMAQAGHDVTFLTTCAQDHFTWANVLPPGERRVDGMAVRYFPVDESRDIPAFMAAQSRISRLAPVTREEELVWLRNSVNSEALYAHLRNDGSRYDRIVMGPYLFGLVYFASRILPDRTLLLPCLHDECFAYLETIREMFTSVRGWIFNAEPERDLAVRLYGINPAGTHVVGLGLDPVAADAARFRQARGIRHPYVLYAGRREPLKGTPLLLDYLGVFRERTRQDIKLVITGSGPVEPPAALAPHVMDLGFVSEQDKHDAMAGALAFCHPSVNESLSIVILESWLAGTPVLVHAGSEVMRNQCLRSNGGLWFRNYPEFEEALMLLIAQPDTRRALAANGKRFVESEYAWPAVESRLQAALGT
jgi:glycosyltransferase involved in cell wall biosynthesis